MSDIRETAPVLWERLTWEEIGALSASGMIMTMLPVGATEQHGPHLATGMDSANCSQLAWAVSQQTGVPVLPVIPFGCSLGHSQCWPGTLSLQPQTLMDLVVQVFGWLHAAGFKKLMIINGHVGNFAPLRCALEIIRSQYEGAMVAIRGVADISARVRAEFFADARDWHANAAETALMMARDPSLVRSDRIATSDDEDRTRDLIFAHSVNRTSTNGVTGFPSRATKQQGERLFAWMVEDLVVQVRAALLEESPLGSNTTSRQANGGSTAIPLPF